MRFGIQGNLNVEHRDQHNGGFKIQSARKKNDDSDFQVFGIKMTGHTGLEEKSKKN